MQVSCKSNRLRLKFELNQPQSTRLGPKVAGNPADKRLLPDVPSPDPNRNRVKRTNCWCTTVTAIYRVLLTVLGVELTSRGLVVTFLRVGVGLA